MCKEYNLNVEGKTLKILKRNDIVQKNDIVRLIVETGYDGGFNLTYKPDDYNPLLWHSVMHEIPAWINKQVDALKFHYQYEYARILED